MSNAPDSFDLSEFPDDDSLDMGMMVKEGTYHLVVESVDTEFTSKKKGTPGVEFVCQVLNGTESSQKGKKLFEDFWYPTPNHDEDARAFLLQRIIKIARVLDLVPESALGKSGVKIPWEKSVGRQFVATVVYNYDKDDKEKKRPLGSQIDGMKMFRINDPEVAEVPKDKDTMALIVGGAYGSETTTVPPKPAASIADL